MTDKQKSKFKYCYFFEPLKRIYYINKCCLSCKYNTDFLWDYTNGIYLFICQKNNSTKKGKCKEWEKGEYSELTDNKYYAQRRDNL